MKAESTAAAWPGAAGEPGLNHPIGSPRARPASASLYPRKGTKSQRRVCRPARPRRQQAAALPRLSTPEMSRRLRATCRHVVASVGTASEPPPLVSADAAPLAAAAPRRFAIADRAGIAEALKHDGVVILCDMPGDQHAPSYWEDAAAALPSLTFGAALEPGAPPVAAVHHEFARSAQTRQLQAKHGITGVLNKTISDEMIAEAEAEGMPHFTTVPWKEMGHAFPHTDGYVYGTHYPDHIFLLMESQNDFGGASYFVDGEAVLQRLSADPQTAGLIPYLSSVPFDQTESEENGGLFQGLESSGPLFNRREDGRLQWKRMLNSRYTQNGQLKGGNIDPDGPVVARSCWAVTPETLAALPSGAPEPEVIMQAVDAAIHEEAAVAGRVRLNRGEAIVVDNYRMLHSREAFGGEGERRLWRVWTWTTASDGRPEGDGAGVSTPLDIHLANTAAAEAAAAK